MAAEIGETPDVVARLLGNETAKLRSLGARLRAIDTAVIVTCARGWSDNAAGYFKYLDLSEIMLPRGFAGGGASARMRTRRLVGGEHAGLDLCCARQTSCLRASRARRGRSSHWSLGDGQSERKRWTGGGDQVTHISPPLERLGFNAQTGFLPIPLQ
jgi:hypothetical protein